MAIFTSIDLHNHPVTQDNIDGISELLIQEYQQMKFSMPRTIYVVSTGIGQAVGENMIAVGLPVEIISQATWNQTAFYCDCSGPYEGETGV